MTFGKRRREEQNFLPIEEHFEDDIQNLDDSADEHEVEPVEVTEHINTSQSVKSNVQAHQPQVDTKLKPLFNEVILRGAAQGKNLGGSKSWTCKHCHMNFTSSYTRMHYHFFGAPIGKKNRH